MYQVPFKRLIFIIRRPNNKLKLEKSRIAASILQVSYYGIIKFWRELLISAKLVINVFPPPNHVRLRKSSWDADTAHPKVLEKFPPTE
jgi:hypothetical protein